MLNDIRKQLERLSATNVKVESDPEFDAETDSLVKITLDDAYWHMQPAALAGLLKDLPAGAGSEAVREAIEGDGHPATMRGPAPEGSRDN